MTRCLAPGFALRTAQTGSNSKVSTFALLAMTRCLAPAALEDVATQESQAVAADDLAEALTQRLRLIRGGKLDPRD